MSRRPDWLQIDWALAQFGNTRGEAVTAYTDFVRAEVGQPSACTDLSGLGVVREPHANIIHRPIRNDRNPAYPTSPLSQAT